jgi:hypothetical protein
MAFLPNNFTQISAGQQVNGMRIWSYTSATDAIATIIASGYFNQVTDKVAKDDVIFVVATDDTRMIEITSATRAATVTVQNYSNGAPYVLFSGEHSYGGGGTSSSATVTGATASMLVQATLKTATNFAIIKAACATDAVDFSFSTDPGAATVVTYHVFSA